MIRVSFHLTEKTWARIARFCARPRVAAWIIRQAQKRPYSNIGGYMHRWWLIPESWNLPIAARVHHILTPDADPFLHDHPWDWRTIVLRNWYEEESEFGHRYFRMKGDTRGCSAETLHRIDRVCPGGVWTLFITRRRRHEWGFITPGGIFRRAGAPRKIHWRSYQSPNGRAQVSEPKP